METTAINKSKVTNQENEGLLSPIIKRVRLKQAASLVPPGSTVLDLACGGGSLKHYLPPGCSYFGVDRIEPPDRAVFDGFLNAELTAPEFWKTLNQWLRRRVDVVTLLAFVEHVKRPEDILASLKDVLKEDGKLILTTPHPVGRNLHDFLARLYLCSRSGAAEHEQFFDESDLKRVCASAGYEWRGYRRFLLGLNQLAEMRPLGSRHANSPTT